MKTYLRAVFQFISLILLAFSTGNFSYAQTLDSEQSAFLTLINNYRAQNGAGPLLVSVALQNSSSWMSDDLASKNYFSHTDSLGRDPFTRMAAFGYPYAPAGENIAAGNSSAQSTFVQWQTACDPDGSGACTFAHNQNMLNPSYVVIGIGRSFNSSATYRWYWTTDFGGVLDQTIGGGPTNPRPVINAFTATPSTLTIGQLSTLSWNVTGATTVAINGTNVGGAGTMVVTPLQTTSYTLTASNSTGTVSAQAIVTVNAATPPVISSFTASPSTVTAGQSAVLSWNVTGASTVTINGGGVPASGSIAVTPGQTTTYTLIATNSGGTSVTAQALVTVVAANAPFVNSFTATPSSVSAGQSSTLSWNVSGATSVSINGTTVGIAGSMVVTPNQTTTYTLTASNGASSVNAQTTVTVSTSIDTQPPSTPNLTSAAAKSGTEVDLIWTASTDNVGVAGYQVLRNGTLLRSVASGSLGFADTTASANTTYSYAIKAFDAAGNTSLSSNSIQATTPSAPAVATCPDPAVNAFTGCYYNNTDLIGNPSLVRTDNQIDFNWGSNSPASAITPLNFSVRWQGMFNLNAGDYTFTAMMSDGFRLYIDGVPVRFAWRDQTPNIYVNVRTLTQGNHLITVEYYEHTGTARALLTWTSPNSAPAPGPAPVINSFTATPATVAAGQSANLSWNVTGATGVTVNGTSVAGTGSMVVTPAQTTAYTLSATNGVSAVTAQAVVTVTAAADTQPPSTPNLTSATAKSATEMDLVWTSSSDNIGVTGYQIIRNGVALNTVGSSSLSYADTTVGANTTYNYVIQAFDAAGNHSLSSNSMQATTPSAPAVTTCPGPAVGAFTGCYYNNTDLLGNPSLVRTDNQISFNWGSGAPASGVSAMNFSARWQGIFSFNAGSYNFILTMSDGFRFYLDGVPLRSAWRDLTPSTFSIPQTITQGNHLITVEYYEHTGTGTAQLSWQKN